MVRPVRRVFALRLSAAFVAAAAMSLAISSGVRLGAASTELFFSEYIEGSSNNKALEIYNDTGGAINLATGGYNVQMFFNGSATAGLTINLTGTVAAGDVFVLAQSAAAAAILAQADQTNGSGWFNGDDAVVLRKGTTVIDSIGQVGFDPGTEWGTVLTSTADNTLVRKPSVSAGDTIVTDAFDPATEWNGFATDTFTNLGCHASGCETAPQITSTFPTAGATDFPITGNLTVTFSEPVNVIGNWFTLSCSLSGSVTATVSGGPTTFVLDPSVDLVDGDACTLTILAPQVTDVDGNDPPDSMAIDFSVGFTANDVCEDSYEPISTIQGSGLSAALPGTRTTQGVVIGDFEGPNNVGIGGFYLQDPIGDGDPATSDGIFVFTGTANTVSAGDVVRVTGFARERFNQTSLNGTNSNTTAVTNIVKCGAASLPAPVEVTLPFSSSDFPERYEGMRVTLPQALVIAEYFNFERFGEVVLAEPLAGETRPFTPTAIVAPGAPALDRAAANALSRITLDDGLGVQNPPVLRHPDGAPFTLAHRFRGGDTVQNVVGVLGFDFSLYRIYPTDVASYTEVNPRTAAPAVTGDLTVAAMNTLNFFLTLNYPTGDPLDNKCGPTQGVECRGADSDQPLEFTRQRDKILAALSGLDADIIGLNELENTTGVDPLGDPIKGLIAGLNGILGPGTYAHINTGVIGTDAIRVGMIYKPARVTPVGAFAVLDTADDPRFIDTRNRPTLAQTFSSAINGAVFTVAVNHLKSKGSACDDIGDPDADDGQGNCNLTREAAAQALVDWLATDPTGSGDADVIILGDLNSYTKEDPITAIRIGADDAAGTLDDYTNLIAKFQGPFAYSYVFDGQAGYLDHALATPTLTKQIAGAFDWHINADEPDVFDYDTSFKPAEQEALYEPNAYRASDHDAVIAGVSPIRFNFSGFMKIVFDTATFNSARAGSSIPLKFSLGGFQGLDIFAAGYPLSRQISCSTLGAGVTLEPTENPGDSALQYDRASDQYNYVWKTEKAWGGTCRQLIVVFADGGTHYANFWFK